MRGAKLRATKSVTLVVAVVVERQSRYEVGTKAYMVAEAEWAGRPRGREALDAGKGGLPVFVSYMR